MGPLNVELCPETGICSVIKGCGKADLMPDEVQAVRGAGGDLARIRAILAEADAGFAASMTDAELNDFLHKLA